MSYTILTEIDLGLDLLWRNNLDPEKAVMALAFYGSSFVAESSSCTSPGSKYGPGTPARTCSNEIGVLLKPEINYLTELFNLEPVLDEAAAVKLLTWENKY